MLFRPGFFLTIVSIALLAAGCQSRPQSPGEWRSRSARARSGNAEAEANRIRAHAHFATAVIHEYNREMDKALEEYFAAATNDLTDETLVLDVSRRLLLARQTEKALELVQRATELPEASGLVYARLGLLYAQLNQKERAIEANRIAIKREPLSLEGYRNLFVIHMQNGEHAAAFDVLNQASRVNGVDAEFMVGLGELYANYGAQVPAQRETAHNSALALLQAAAQTKPTDPHLHVRLANAFNMLGREQEAATVYEELLQQMRDAPLLRDSIRARLADIYLRARDNQRAARQLENILRDNPTDEQAYYYLGKLAEQEGEFAQAAEHFSKILLLNPDAEQAYYELASAQIRADKSADALETLTKAREKFQPGFFMEYLTAVAFMGEEQFTNAVSHFSSAEVLAATQPGMLDASFYFQFGAASERAGDYAQAEKKFEKCLELDENYAEAQNYLGYMLAERGEQLERAHDLISKALKAEPESAAYLDSMGWVLFKLNRHEEALKYLLEAVQRSEEDDPVLYDHLGDIYDALQQKEKAREAWSKSVSIEDKVEVRKKLESSER